MTEFTIIKILLFFAVTFVAAVAAATSALKIKLLSIIHIIIH